MKILIGAGLIGCVLAFPSFASNPGDPLNCSDMVFNVSGLSCVPFVPVGQIVDGCGTDLWWKGSNLAVDNLGAVYYVKAIGCGCGIEVRSSIEIRRTDGVTDQLVASLPYRPSPVGFDGVEPRTECPSAHVTVAGGVQFDPMNGRLLVWLVSLSSTTDCVGCFDSWPWIASIGGFATTFEVLQTYVPQPASVAFRVPYMPEGMAAADHFDTYWGTLAHPIDFAQAHPLRCGYPASSPHVGDYLTVIDTLPDPPPGAGYFYVTAATYLGQTRYGRKTSNGHLSGRDPALLPACLAAPSSP